MNWSKCTFIALLMFSGFCLTSSALAQSQGGVQVEGDVTIEVDVEDVTTVGIGDDVIVESNVGAVIGNNTAIRGDVNIDVDAENITTVGIGKEVKACSNVGVVGTSACQKDDN
ncbi:MAG: hypothetical protein MI750_03540 [Xanthomonadales bacterium]|jgi:hypothetical protein|nr:hypothetical protein [Xanthomonadales bacterium]